MTSSSFIELKLHFWLEAKSGNITELRKLYQTSVALNVTLEIINVQNGRGLSALSVAILIGNIETAEYIIDIGADVNVATSEKDIGFAGNTPLIEASGLGYLSLVNKLIERGAKINATSEDGTHALYLAAQNGYFDIVKILVEKDPNVTDLRGYLGRTPLMVAAKNGHLGIVKYFMSLPLTNINSQDNDENTPLIWAAFNNHSKIVENLLENGANTSVKDAGGNTALYWSTQLGYINIVKLLAEKDPSDANIIGFKGRTPLITAAQKGYLDIVKYLSSLPQNKIDSQDDDGNTALMLSIANNHLNIVQFLVLREVDPNLKNDQGQTPLITAAMRGFLNIANYISSLPQVNIDAQDNFGVTALGWASYNNHPDIVEHLLKRGANLSIKDSFGKTAFDWATSQNHNDVIEMFEKYS